MYATRNNKARNIVTNAILQDLPQTNFTDLYKKPSGYKIAAYDDILDILDTWERAGYIPIYQRYQGNKFAFSYLGALYNPDLTTAVFLYITRDNNYITIV